MRFGSLQAFIERRFGNAGAGAATEPVPDTAPPARPAPPVIPHPTPLGEEHLRNCRFVADRELLLEHLPRGGVVAEVGVLAGDYSARILEITSPAKLHLIDSYDASDWPQTARFVPDTHEAFVRSRFRAEIDRGVVEIRRGLSWEQLATLPDQAFDWIYIDAGHDYESVRKGRWPARD